MRGTLGSQSLEGFNRFVRIVHTNIHHRNEQIDSTAKGFSPSMETAKAMIPPEKRPEFEPASYPQSQSFAPNPFPPTSLVEKATMQERYATPFKGAVACDSSQGQQP